MLQEVYGLHSMDHTMDLQAGTGEAATCKILMNTVFNRNIFLPKENSENVHAEGVRQNAEPECRTRMLNQNA